MSIVIIGAGPAGISAIEAIRKVDKSVKITLISDEEFHTYSRPLISYLLLGKTTQEKMIYRSKDFFIQNDVDVILGKKVTSISSTEKKVILENSTAIEYDKLLLATGSRPFVPPFTGLDKVKKQFTFLKLDDALKIQKEVKKGTKVLIVGAGLIGLKCAEGISKDASITVVDLSTNVLSSILDLETSIIMKHHLEKNNINLKLGITVNEFQENKAILTDKTEIEFDVLVLAIGVRPNVELFEQIKGKTDRGIIVDETMQTSVKGIYAAGDIIKYNDVSCNKEKIMAILPNAYITGEVAGYNMAGKKTTVMNLMPFNSIGLFGLHVSTGGSQVGEVITYQDDSVLRKLYVNDNKLAGYIVLGDIKNTGTLNYLIRNQISLNDFDVNQIAEKPGLLAFNKALRTEMLKEGLV